MVKSMKIIIADAKSLKEKHFPIEKQTPLFFNKAEYLRKQLKELNIDQIHDLMKISFKQSSLIYDYFHNEENFAALNLFDGVVLAELGRIKLDNKKRMVEYIKKNNGIIYKSIY